MVSKLPITVRIGAQLIDIIDQERFTRLNNLNSGNLVKIKPKPLDTLLDIGIPIGRPDEIIFLRTLIEENDQGAFRAQKRTNLTADIIQTIPQVPRVRAGPG